MSVADTLRTDLLTVARAYCEAKGMALSSLGLYIRKDSRYFGKLIAGETTMVAEVYDHCIQWMSDGWPSKCRWPPHIARPAPKKETA